MPGDLAMKIAMAQYGEDGLTKERIELVRQETGLQKSTVTLYLGWLGRMLRLDLGHSMITGDPVLNTLGFHLQLTLKLAVAALTFSLIVAFPVGICAGLKPGSTIDLLSAAFSSLIVSMPSFVLGACLIILFSIKFQLLPAAGFNSPAAIVLPAVTLGFSLAAVSCRVIRTSVVTVKDSFFILFARLKGIPKTRIFLDHGMKNGAVPIITFLALQFAHVLDGVVVLENLFNWPGIGFLLLESIRGRDLTMIQGVTLIIGLTYVGLNLAADLICAWLDPRHLAAGGEI
jgi:peptide/nickel transport system permease protein